MNAFDMRELESELLLAIARAAVAERFGAPALDVPPRAWLDAPAATFVSISLFTPGDRMLGKGQLHGCIGSIEPRRSLHQDLRHNAVMAAFSDPRSRALRADELGSARFSVSILGPRTPLGFADEADARAQLRPRIDGLILAWQGHRGVFLPKVWDTLPEPRAFLDNLKRKAGLPSDFWRQQVTLERFEVLEFEEPAPA